jgi:preprotein translocase subunit SecE
LDKYVRLSFVVVGILAWAVVSGLLATVLAWISPNLNRPLLGPQFAVSDLLGAMAGLTVAIVLWFNVTVNKLGGEVANELRNVTWPTWPETRVSTIVVVVTTIVVALILGLFDLVIGKFSTMIYRL